MHEIVVISGKGGTGKTTVCAAFAHLMKNGVLCDLDVDAPDLHILSDPQILKEHRFISGQEATINTARCVECGICMERCHFHAIKRDKEGEDYRINGLRCEGCGVCAALCPESAITMTDKYCGDWYESMSRFGPMFHAQLFPGEENSGRLVSLLKQKAREYAKDKNLDVILCDGSPGIGCPVISSLSGAHLAVAVVEPTPSGRHDFIRVADLCDHFRIALCVIINKADLNHQESAALRELCARRSYTLAGELPFHQDVIDSMINKKTLTETDSPVAEQICKAWAIICEKAANLPRTLKLL